jgi:hypothetical protein
LLEDLATFLTDLGTSGQDLLQRGSHRASWHDRPYCVVWRVEVLSGMFLFLIETFVNPNLYISRDLIRTQ